MLRNLWFTAAFGAGALLWASPAWAELKVVATIKPIHGLVAEVMGDKGKPGLVIEGLASEHTTSLKPSQLRLIEEADVIFAVGEGMEVFLKKTIEERGGEGRPVVELAETKGVTVLPFREEHEHEHEAEEAAHKHEAEEAEHKHEGEEEHAEGHDHHHGPNDPHIWLDPENAKAMAGAIAEALAAADPANAAVYRANAGAVGERIAALDASLKSKLEPVKAAPFVGFHDAYQYFVRHYGLNWQGAIAVSPEQMPGARRLKDIKDTIAEKQVKCVFAEPQFEVGYVRTVIEGTDAKAGTLDPIGAAVPAGTGAYERIMTDIANTLADCLGKP